MIEQFAEERARIVAPPDEFPNIDAMKTDPDIQQFKELWMSGKEEREIELYGCKWTIATLEECEHRTIIRRAANIPDEFERGRVRMIDVVAQAVMKVTSAATGYTLVCDNIRSKQILRWILLASYSKVVIGLFRFQQMLEALAAQKFEDQWGSVEKELADDFFGQPGSSTKRSSRGKGPMTRRSSGSSTAPSGGRGQSKTSTKTSKKKRTSSN